MATGIKYNFNMSAEDIERGSASVKNRAASLRTHVHCLAVSILTAWASSGAANVAAQRASVLLDSVDASHKQKIVNWFAVFANFTYDVESKSFRYTDTTINVEGVQKAKEKTAFDLTKDPDAKPMDLIADLKKLLDRAKKARAKGNSEKVPSAMVKALEGIVDGADGIIAAAAETASETIEAAAEPEVEAAA